MEFGKRKDGQFYPKEGKGHGITSDLDLLRNEVENSWKFDSKRNNYLLDEKTRNELDKKEFEMFQDGIDKWVDKIELNDLKNELNDASNHTETSPLNDDFNHLYTWHSLGMIDQIIDEIQDDLGIKPTLDGSTSDWHLGFGNIGKEYRKKLYEYLLIETEKKIKKNLGDQYFVDRNVDTDFGEDLLEIYKQWQ